MKFLNHLQRLCPDNSGNIAIMFGLAVLPMMLGVGMALDYGRTVTTKTKVQSALDAAALATAAASDLSIGDRKKLGRRVLKTNLGELASAVQLKTSFKFSGSKLTMIGKGAVKPTIMQLAGYTDIPFSTRVTVPLQGAGKAEIVLVLDYSDSMLFNDKYITMRDAAKALIKSVTNDFKNDDVKIGIVPFASMVYATMNKRHIRSDAHSLDRDGDTGDNSWSGCTQDRHNPYNVTDATPAKSENKSKWGNGKPGDYYDMSLNPGYCDTYEANSLEVLPLTNDFDQINNKLDKMVPALQTHIALGVEFGWHLLSPNAPFKQGTAYGDDETVKAMVILTDGLQTSLAWGPGGHYSSSAGDDNLKALCDNIKANNIMVFTIAYDLNLPSNHAVENCASDGKLFKNPTDGGGELVAAFKGFAGELKKAMLRLLS